VRISLIIGGKLWRSNPPDTSLGHPLRSSFGSASQRVPVRWAKFISLPDVSVFAKHLARGVEDSIFLEQKHRRNDFRVFALFGHLSGRLKNFIAPFDGGFSGERAKPFPQLRVARDGVYQNRQGVESGAGVCCHDCVRGGVSNLCRIQRAVNGFGEDFPRRIFLSCFARLAINDVTEIAATEFFQWSNF
jgi:hypothetical protein